MILAITCGDEIIHAPRGRHGPQAGDVLVVYCHKGAISELQELPAGQPAISGGRRV